MLGVFGDANADYDNIVKVVKQFVFGEWSTTGWGPGPRVREYSFPIVFRLVVDMLRREYGGEEVQDFWTHPVHYLDNEMEELEWPTEMWWKCTALEGWVNELNENIFSKFTENVMFTP